MVVWSWAPTWIGSHGLLASQVLNVSKISSSPTSDTISKKLALPLTVSLRIISTSRLLERRMDADTAVKEKVVLHVGCGTKRNNALHEKYQTSEWQEIRLDIDPGVEPDIIASMTDMSMVSDASVDAVWTSHSLEHIFAHEVPIALNEFYRVLRPKGHVLIRLPDLEKAADLLVKFGPEATVYESPVGPITPLDMIFGYGRAMAEDAHWMQHRTGFTQSSIISALEKAGFEEVVAPRKGPDLWAIGKKL